MTEPLCLECLFKRNRQQVFDKKIEWTSSCKMCTNGTKTQKCIDGCGANMVWCKVVKYWHNGDKPGKCPLYKKRKVKKQSVKK